MTFAQFHGGLPVAPTSCPPFGSQRDVGVFVNMVKISKKDLVLDKFMHTSPSGSRFMRMGLSVSTSDRSLSSIIENMTLEGDEYKLPEGEEISALVRKVPSEPNLEVAVRTIDLVMKHNIRISINTFSSLLQRCSQNRDIISGKKVHEQLLENGYKENVLLANMLIDMYGKCGSEVDAQEVFDGMSNRNMYSWSTLISAYAYKGMVKKAIELCTAMRKKDNNRPDKLAFITLLRAISEKQDIAMARAAHHEIRACSLLSDVMVGNALIEMYGKCQSLSLALEVFQQLPEYNVGSWTALIEGYLLQGGREKEIFNLYELMREQGIEPDEDAYLPILKACSKIKDVEKATYIHSQIVGSGYESGLVVGNALMEMYMEMDNLQCCRIIFEKMHEHDRKTWNSIIIGHVENGYVDDALFLYEQMQDCIITPDEVTLANAIRACSDVYALDEGFNLHDTVIASGFESVTDVANALIRFYSKCCMVNDARTVFDAVSEKNSWTWNEMVIGYAQNGYSHQAFKLFDKMCKEGIMLERSSCIALLQCCVEMGGKSLNWGRKIHSSIIGCGFGWDSSIGDELVIMYSKCDSHIDSQLMLNRMDEVDIANRSFA